MSFDAKEEFPHPASGHPAWFESWVLECVTEDASIGIRMELRVRPDQARSQFSLLLIRRERPVVWVDESEAPLPKPGLELRASGLWVEFIAQEPHAHFTADLEAFAVELEDPADAMGSGYGRRVPVACELEWQTRGERVAVEDGYRLPCFVMGDFQVGHEDLMIDGFGWRAHTWGMDAGATAGYRGRGDEDVGLVVGWGYGLDGERHRVIETETGFGWRTLTPPD